VSEKYDYLAEGGVKIMQGAGGYRFTSDAVALGKFARCKSGDVLVDVGCGGGVVGLAVNDRCKPRRVVAIDIQEEAVRLARRNVELNGLDNFEVVCADVREIHKRAGYSNFADVVVCNPPYFSGGQKSVDVVRAGARHDDTLTLDEMIAAVTRIIKYGGMFYMCYPAPFVARVVTALTNANFRIRQLKFLKNEKEIYLVLIAAKKSTGESECVVGVEGVEKAY